MKLLVLLSLLVFSVNVLANKTEYKNARKLYLTKNYAESISLIKNKFNLKKISTVPNQVLFLLSMNYRKLKKYETEEKLLNFIKKRSYSVQSERFENDQKSASKSTLYTYYKIASNQYLLYKKTNNTRYKKRAIKYFKLLKSNGKYKLPIIKQYLSLLKVEPTEEIIISDLTNKEPLINQTEKKPKQSGLTYGLNIGYINWSESSRYENLLNKDSADLDITFNALTAGGLVYYQMNSILLSAKMSGFFAKASITESSNTISYSETGVTSIGVLTELEGLYNVYHPNLHLGISLPFLYRTIDFPQPNDTLIENKTIMHTGFLLTSKWKQEKIEYKVKAGTVNSKLLIGFDVAYLF